MSDLLRAADAIDALTDALPEALQVPWLHFADQVYVEHNGNDHVFAWADTNRTTSPAGNAETTAHIAALASPDRARALTALLREIDSDLGDDRHRLDEIRAVAADLARLYVGSQP